MGVEPFVKLPITESSHVSLSLSSTFISGITHWVIIKFTLFNTPKDW